VNLLVAALLIATPIAGLAGWPLTSADCFVQAYLQPSVEAVVWAGDHPTPGLGNWDDDAFFAPRLRLKADASAGSLWFLHVNTALDRGFDPGSRADGETRLDEAFLRLRPFEDERLNIQLGKFASFFGGWIPQHDFFDDAFLLAPLPYSQIIGIQTRDPAALSPDAITARSIGRALAFATLDKQNWASTVWGPNYATGVGTFGSIQHFDYAVEFKNAGLSAHPDSWEELNFAQPTVAARLGYRPDAAWAFGISGSHGSYVEKGAPLLKFDRGSLARSSAGFDARWSHHSLIISSEIIYSTFETLAAGDLETVGWYLQTRWKAAPGLWIAGRFGQILANDLRGTGGVDTEWQPDIWRAEAAVGWRVTSQLLIKASYAHTEGDAAAGNDLLGLGLGYQF
jgi:hypothetical protein